MKFTKKHIHNIDYNFYLIEDKNDLKEFLKFIEDNDIIALDTEFTRRTTYYPILSTIQIALKKNNKKILGLIDVVKCEDISDLISLINNHKIIKILHSSTQDLQIFHLLSKQFPQNIFDTQIMANFCLETANIGYSNLVKKFFEVEICKKMQNSDWQFRPLTQKQIEYALTDVIFLHEIYELFTTQLIKNNSRDWFIEEMKSFVNKSLSDNSRNLIYSFNLARFNDMQVFLISELVALREKFAQNFNLPRQHLFSDNDLENLVINFPNFDYNNLKLPQNFKDEIKKLISKKTIDYKVAIPQKLSDDEKEKINKIKSLVAKIAKKYNFNEQFLLNNNQMKNIVKARNIEQIKCQIGNWRFNLLSSGINQILYNNHENNNCKLENESRL